MMKYAARGFLVLGLLISAACTTTGGVEEGDEPAIVEEEAPMQAEAETPWLMPDTNRIFAAAIAGCGRSAGAYLAAADCVR